MLAKVSIVKSKGGATSGRGSWRNTYTLDIGAVALGDPSIATLVGDLVTFEKAFALDDTYFDRAVVSIIRAPHGGPAPQDLQVIPLSGQGVVAAGGAAVAPLAMAAVIAFSGGTGRSALHKYRNCLLASDVTSNSTGGLTLGGLVTAHIHDNAITPLAALATPFAGMKIPNHKSADGTPARAITVAAVAGVSLAKLNHRHKGKIPTNKSSLAAQALKAVEEIGALAAGIRVIATAGTVIAPAFTAAVDAALSAAEALLPLAAAL